MSRLDVGQMSRLDVKLCYVVICRPWRLLPVGRLESLSAGNTNKARLLSAAHCCMWCVDKRSSVPLDDGTGGRVLDFPLRCDCFTPVGDPLQIDVLLVD